MLVGCRVKHDCILKGIKNITIHFPGGEGGFSDLYTLLFFFFQPFPIQFRKFHIGAGFIDQIHRHGRFRLLMLVKVRMPISWNGIFLVTGTGCTSFTREN